MMDFLTPAGGLHNGMVARCERSVAWLEFTQGRFKGRRA